MSIELSGANGFIYEPVRGSQRKIHFEERGDGGFDRVESVWTGCEWRETDRERCTTMRRVN
jgi:hypothetical protein